MAELLLESVVPIVGGSIILSVVIGLFEITETLPLILLCLPCALIAQFCFLGPFLLQDKLTELKRGIRKIYPEGRESFDARLDLNIPQKSNARKRVNLRVWRDYGVEQVYPDSLKDKAQGN